jgi:hypothetical protein
MSDIQGYAAAAGLPTDPQQLLALMPTDVQAQIHAGVTTYGNLGPAISLAQTVSGGGVPDEAAILAGVSAAASMISPLAGAAMGVAGAVILGAESLMQSFFDALGLYDHPRLVKCCGLRVASSIPYGPSDPVWAHIRTVAEFHNATFHVAGLGPGDVCDYGSLLEVTAAGVRADMLNRAVMIVDPAFASSLPAAWAPTVFDRYFAHLLQADLEAWANCNPYIQPRQLLMAAQAAWNGAHSASSTRTYVPLDARDWSDPSLETDLVGEVLGNEGDPKGGGTRAAPLVVNLGAPVQAQPRVIAIHLPAAALDRAKAAARPTAGGSPAPGGGALAVGALALGLALVLKPAFLRPLLAKIGIR